MDRFLTKLIILLWSCIDSQQQLKRIKRRKLLKQTTKLQDSFFVFCFFFLWGLSVWLLVSVFVYWLWFCNVVKIIIIINSLKDSQSEWVCGSIKHLCSRFNHILKTILDLFPEFPWILLNPKPDLWAQGRSLNLWISCQSPLSQTLNFEPERTRRRNVKAALKLQRKNQQQSDVTWLDFTSCCSFLSGWIISAENVGCGCYFDVCCSCIFMCTCS